VIETLRIKNLAIVEEVELELGPGLNVLTGETGAGKSIVLGALGLLAGGRGTSGLLRTGAESGLVEAVFSTEGLPELEARLLESGLEPDDHELVVSRSLAQSGRTRARVAGQLMPVSSLAELFAGRIEISSQHSSQALLRPESHGLYLDQGGGLMTLRRRVGDGYSRLRALAAELAELRERADERVRRRDFLAFQLAEIDAVGLRANELDALNVLHARLAHAEKLREDGSAAYASLVGDPLSAQPAGADGAVDLLGAALRLVEGLQKLDPGFAGFVESLRSLETELRDTASELERYIDGVEIDPGGLSEVEERLGQIERLRRKYGGTVAEILAYRERVALELEALEGADERIGELVSERERCHAELTAAAEELSKRRAKAARKLERLVGGSLRSLAMPRARFEICLEPAPVPEGLPCGSVGREVPEFRFSANAGESPRPLRKVASGGELSRVFLAVKNALRPFGEGMVLVFDEVDADVGGGVAERVGRSLAELAEHHQVLCITHLPQIAAFADVHFRVRKHEREGRTLAVVERIDGSERIDEIARMAGGESVTPVTRRHAEALLGAREPS
jgi:DNA repair protein RecN (Recombination protein N)